MNPHRITNSLPSPPFGLSTATAPVKIDEATLKALKDSKTSNNIKVINLINSILKTAADEGGNSPYLKPIGERAEAIKEAFDDRQITALDALKKGG